MLFVNLYALDSDIGEKVTEKGLSLVLVLP